MKNILKTAATALAVIAFAIPAGAQIEGSALNYMLQRPRVAKEWRDQKPFGHLFVDAGIGFNMMGRRSPEMGVTAEMNIGNWFTPEHGVRLNVNGGAWSTDGLKAKYAALGIDYLLNITALAQPGRYYEPKRFEVYGIGGIDLAMSHNGTTTNYGLGAHVGLRGQLALSRFTYAYLEPRFGLVEDQISHVNTWHGYRPYGIVTVGFGYRVPSERRHYDDPYRGRHGFADGLFVSALVGPSFLANAHISTWDDYTGVRSVASVGKWFDPYNAVRLSLGATTVKPYGVHRTKALGVQLDYMLNMHNAFGGVDPERWFWVNGVAGFSFNRSADDRHYRRNSWGAGAGLQANVRLSRGLTFALEPRVDMYTEHFIPRYNTFRRWDVMPSLLAGFTYTYHDSYALARRAEGKRGERRASFSIAGGLASAANKLKQSDFWMPVARISYTGWSRSANGLRLSLDGTMQRYVENKRYAKAVAAVDWLADLTAMNYGTDHQGWLSLRTVAGFAVGADYGEQKAYFASDVHVGGQARIRLSQTTGLFIEPQMAYELSKRFEGRNWGRVTPRVLVGFDYTMHREKRSSELSDAPEERNFIDVSGGIGYYSGTFGKVARRDKLTYNIRAGYGRWLNGVHGVYGSVSNTFAKRPGNTTDNITALSVDYMMNLRNAITGEQNDDRLFQLTGLAGAQLGINSGEGHSTKVAPGVNAALQAGFRVSRHVELYVEPSATVYTKNIDPQYGSKPANGELNVKAGLKLHF